jgi:TetR/AcrR family fatty acid metabolism transcriptional regulator
MFRRDLSATITAKIFFGALDEMATNWILSHRKYSLVSEADTVVEVLLNGIKGKAVASSE